MSKTIEKCITYKINPLPLPQYRNNRQSFSLAGFPPLIHRSSLSAVGAKIRMELLMTPRICRMYFQECAYLPVLIFPVEDKY